MDAEVRGMMYAPYCVIPRTLVIPAKAGTHRARSRPGTTELFKANGGSWVPAFAGMTIDG